ncbi:MAG: type II toxin-antitoxin system Phd/YefM family antitoxin [Janthinobacterium lividum]
MISLVAIADFKANCHKIIERAQNQQSQITLTKNGKPIATITPIIAKEHKPSIFGMLAGRASICGDIVNTDTSWDADNE